MHKMFINKVTNPFWKDILLAWSKSNENIALKTLQDFITASFWYNPKIGTEAFFLPNWYNAGIFCTADIMDSKGILSKISLEKKYKIKINFLEYHRVKRKVEKFTTNIKDSYCPQPIIPKQVECLHTTKKCTKSFYCSQLKGSGSWEDYGQIKLKWDKHLKANINLEDWKGVYQICFISIDDNNIKWFQYRVIHMLLGTRQYQFKTKILDNPMCGYCNSSEETIKHLFCECAPITSFWNDLRNYVQQKLNLRLNLKPVNIILGQLKTDSNYTFCNILYIITKKYIFLCSKTNKNSNLLGLLKKSGICIYGTKTRSHFELYCSSI